MSARARSRGEQGMALIISLVVLVIAGLLSGVAIDTAVGTNRITRSDTDQAAALAAANAGLAVATYRLNMLAPDASHCVTSVVNLPSNGVCPIDGPESLGDGASYQFQVTPPLTGGTCAGETVTNTRQAVTDRCVSAIGTANGATARTEARVDAWAAQPFFAYPGITGLNAVTITGNATVNAGLASNGKVSLTGNQTAGAVSLGGGTGSLVTTGNVTTGGTSNVSKIGATAVPVGNSATVNSDARITSGQDASSGVTFNAATRSVSATGNASLTLGGTVYNFCNLTLTGNSWLTIAAGVKTEIIIDSPDDPNSNGCLAGSGNLSITGNSIVTTSSGTSTALQIYVYGTNNGLNVVNFTGNGTNTFATIFAPQSTIDLTGNVSDLFTGAILGLAVNVTGNFDFAYGSDAGALTSASEGLYYRSAWAQCPASPTTSGNLSSGC